MALQKQTKQFIFAKGVDSHIAPEVLPVGQLHSAENVRIPQLGKFSKQFGVRQINPARLPNNYDTSSLSLTGAKALFTNQNGLYGVFNTTNKTPLNSATNIAPDDIYSYSATDDRWAYMSRSASYSASSSPIPLGLNVSFGGYLEKFSSTIDVVNLNGYIFTVTDTEPVTGASVLNIFDTVSQSTLGTITLTGIYWAKLAVFGNRVIAYGWDSNTGIQGYNFDTTSLTLVLPSLIVFVTDVSVSGNPLFDGFVAAFNGNFYLTYVNNAGGIGLYQYSSIVTSGTASPANFTNIAETTVKCLTIFGGESTYQKVYVAYTKAGTGVRVNICNMSLGGSSIVTAYAYEARGLAGGATTGNVILLGQFDSSAADSYLNITYFACNATTVTRNSSFYNYGMYLGSKPARINGLWHILLISSDSTEYTYFLTYLPEDLSGVYQLLPVAKLLFGNAGPNQNGADPIRRYCLPQLTVMADGNYITGGMKRAGGTNEGPNYVPQLLTFNAQYPNNKSYLNREIGGLTYFTGGFPTCFDGRQLFEAAFLLSPITPISATASGGGSLSAGTYQFCVVHEFTDALGNLHQSAPSVPVSITVTAGQKFTFTAFAPAMTMHQNVNIAVYRTLANQTLFQLEVYLSFPGSTGFSQGKQITGTCTIADSTLQNEELLYTTGDVIENQCPTATSAITIWKDRVWFITDDGVEYSKVITDGTPAAFNPVFNINTLVNKGKPRAIAAQLDKLLVMFLDNIYYTTGDGPSDVGDGSFTPLELASLGVGAVSAASVVEADYAVYFQSRDGYRAIEPNLNIDYLGSELDNWINEATTIYSASYFDTHHEVRIMDGARMYVYDTKFKQWLTRPKSPDIYGIVWTPKRTSGLSRRFVSIKGARNVWQEDSTIFYVQDISAFVTPYQMVLRTGWITMDQFLGFERIYKIIVLGRYYTDHTLNVNLYFNYMPQVVETHSISASSASLGLGAYTDDNVYSNDSYAGNGYPYELQIKPSLQKCTALRVEIFDSSGSGSQQNLDLVGMNLVLGVKAADHKIRDVVTMAQSGSVVTPS